MAKDRSKTENNVIDFNQAKQKLENLKSSTTVLDQQEEDEEYYFEIEFDNDE